jgi:hypothetical protein
LLREGRQRSRVALNVAGKNGSRAQPRESTQGIRPVDIHKWKCFHLCNRGGKRVTFPI